jgi:indole-3-glycerol phosphate synthase/phosphoribosylanthranilate isomerase
VSATLERILAATRERVRERKRRAPLDGLPAGGSAPILRRRFGEALARPSRVNVIAEFKRRSPSRGAIRADADPARVARAYEAGGAAALSVLTDEPFFGGSLEDLARVRAAASLPVLRKDFIVDPYQVAESAAAGADAVLLIVAALPGPELGALHAAAAEAGLEVLVEVHDRAELARARGIGARVIGVNSRDLRTMTVDLRTALGLAAGIPDDVVAVAESGIRTPEDVRRLRDAGYDAFLVGEHLMAHADPAAALQDLIRGASSPAEAAPPRVALKVCGITSVEDALLAAGCGADAVGLVLWPGSPRAVGLEAARGIAAALPAGVDRVGVFVDPSREDVVRAVGEIGLDVVQLHGDEPPGMCRGLGARVLKAVRVGPGFRAEQALRYEGQADGLLLDTRLEGGAPGGTGRAFDWALARGVREGARFLMLAGGLTAENVREAVAAVGPDAVDVSSGVESAPGRKDPARLRAFARALRGER